MDRLLVDHVAKAIMDAAEVDSGFYPGDSPYLENPEECAEAAIKAVTSYNKSTRELCDGCKSGGFDDCNCVYSTQKSGIIL